MKINDQLSVLFMLEKSRPTPEGLLPITVRDQYEKDGFVISEIEGTDQYIYEGYQKRMDVSDFEELKRIFKEKKSKELSIVL